MTPILRKVDLNKTLLKWSAPCTGPSQTIHVKDFLILLEVIAVLYFFHYLFKYFLFNSSIVVVLVV